MRGPRKSWPLVAIGILSAALMAAPAAAQSASIVVNGGFESPVVPNGWSFFSAGSTAITGWVVGSGSVEIDRNNWQNAGGAQSVDLNGYDQGSIYQDLTTVPGQPYTLSFYVTGNPDCGAGTKQMAVLWGQSPVASLSVNTAGITNAAMQWQGLSYSVIAGSASTRLAFNSLTPGSCGTVIDSVSVTPIPVTFSSVCKLVHSDVTNAGIANSLCAKLDAAARAAARGNAHAVSGALGAFLNEVSAQTGKALTAAQATLLTEQAQILNAKVT